MYRRVVQLVADVAVDVESRHQQVVDALEQRVADEHHGLRPLAEQALHHRGAVEVAEHRERGVRVAAVAVPQQLQLRRLPRAEALVEIARSSPSR